MAKDAKHLSVDELSAQVDAMRQAVVDSLPEAMRQYVLFTIEVVRSALTQWTATGQVRLYQLDDMKFVGFEMDPKGIIAPALTGTRTYLQPAEFGARLDPLVRVAYGIAYRNLAMRLKEIDEIIQKLEQKPE